MEHDELKTVIVEALQEHENRKRQQELVQSGGWRVVEYIAIVLFAIGMIALLLNIPLMESEGRTYTVFEMHEKLAQEEQQQMNHDEMVAHELDYASFYASSAGITCGIVLIVVLAAIMMAAARYHTREEIVDKLTILLAFATLMITVYTLARSRT